MSTIIPVTLSVIESRRYDLDRATVAVVGAVNQNLAAKLSYDPQGSRWQFNKSTETKSAATTASLTSQAGGGGKDDTSLYRTDFPRDPKQGLTFTDAQTKLAFKVTPQFDMYGGRESDGRLIYPLKTGTKLIYTAKNNGMKEDIVIPRFIDKELTFSYKITLPKTLTMKVQGDGSVGIFSASPALFGNVSTGSNMDAEKLKSARENTEKTHLLFAIPAPVIVQSGGKMTKATAKFGLAGDVLTVTARDMDTVAYPASVDPSVVVTNTSDFATGNAEDNINYVTDQINRGTTTGGGITAGWTSTGSGSFTARSSGGSAAYNGHIYYVGGDTGASSSEVSYAPINSNGTIGSWNTTTSLPTARMNLAAVAYNGKLYVYGGYTSGTSALNSVIYADINSDGTLGGWTTASNTMTTAVCRFGATAYNGYLYAAGGATGTVASSCDDSSATNTDSLQFAPILGNGDIGAWTASTHTFANARKDPGLAVYNGYAYITSGTTDGSTTYSDTQIAKISSSGDVGSWRVSSHTIPTSGKYRFGYRAYNGYLYLNGGANNLTGTLYAPIYSNGDIGPWQSSATMTTGRYGQGFASYQGYTYYFGGYTGSTYLNDTGYARLDDPGTASTSSATTAFGSGLDAATAGAGFMYNNYLYYAGGNNGTDNVTQVVYAPINGDGTLGSWSATSALQPPVASGVGLSAMSYAIYNSRIYVVGGITAVGGVDTDVGSIQYASFNSDGTLGTWTLNTTDLPFVTANRSATAYNGFLYMNGQSGTSASDRIYRAPINGDGTIGSWVWDGGGSNNISTSTNYATVVTQNKFLYIIGGYNGSTYIDDVQYAPINSDGTLGSWSTTSSLQVAKSRAPTTILNGYIYVVGGETSGATDTSTVEYAKINADGTLGSWVSSANLALTVSRAGIATRNDRIYLISGRQAGSREKDVLYITARNGGGGANGAWTTSGNTFATARQNHGSAIVNGYIYVIGGVDSSGTYLDSVQYAKLNDDGSVGSWGSTTTLSAAKASMGVAVHGDHLYTFGGKTGVSTVTDAVYSAPINSNGTIGSWTPITSLPDQLASMSVVTHGSYVYLLGGIKSSPYSTVQYAQINTDGTTGSWSSTNSFNGARSDAGAVSNGDYIYVLGGVDGSSGYYKDVQYAPINSNGTIGSWSTTTDMNYARSSMTPTVLNGFMYIYGGYNGSAALSNVEYAPLNPSGTIGGWTSGASQTNARSGHHVDTYNGYAYLTGGNGSSYYDNILYSSIQSVSRSATYSKLFDLGSLYTLTGISYGGTLPNGTDAITYRTAGTDGLLGTPSRAGSISAPSTVCIAGDTRYVFVTVTLDDSSRSAYADAGSSTTYLSHLSVDYSQLHAPTEKRLAHGKYFQDETLQPVDACSI